MIDERKNYLGIDWGAARVGVALAHAEARVAMGYATLVHDDKLLSRLGEIIKAEAIGTVIIGIPPYPHREKVLPPAKKFGQLLLRTLPVRVEYQNEMFTTKTAQANLIEGGTRQPSKHNDEEAARIILAEWLEKDSPSRLL